MRLVRLSYLLRPRGNAKSRYGSLVAHRECQLSALTNAKPSTQFGLIIEFVSIFDPQFLPQVLWNFDGACLSCKVTGLCPESAV